MGEELRLGFAHDDGWGENDSPPSFQRHQIACVLFHSEPAEAHALSTVHLDEWSMGSFLDTHT